MYQSTGSIDKRDIVTLHIIADALVKAIPYGLKDQESERRFKGNLTRFQNDSTVQTIQDKYPSVTFGLVYDDLFAATCFSGITWKAV